MIDSDVYKTELKATDRKLMACEMEAAGFVIAEQFLQASARAVSQFISLRCISDVAANKHTAESGVNTIKVAGKEIRSREWAMRNTTMLSMFLVDRQVINADINAQLGELKMITTQLEARKKETRMRPIHRTQTTEGILAIITNVTAVGKLERQQCITFCADRIPDLDTANMAVGALRNAVSGHFQPTSTTKRSADGPAVASRSAKKPRLGEFVAAGSASSAVSFSTPARSGATSDDNEPTQLDDATEEEEVEMVPLSALQKYVDNLAVVIRTNAFMQVPETSSILSAARCRALLLIYRRCLKTSRCFGDRVNESRSVLFFTLSLLTGSTRQVVPQRRVLRTTNVHSGWINLYFVHGSTLSRNHAKCRLSPLSFHIL